MTSMNDRVMSHSAQQIVTVQVCIMTLSTFISDSNGTSLPSIPAADEVTQTKLTNDKDDGLCAYEQSAALNINCRGQSVHVFKS